ncbi:MAG TPA: ribosome maturation factor RimP [Nitrospinae bacterium]|jgi:ribosome maturation factor RimP|nr:ribosome maturation factor RimP [Nitrospinota bacterium]
MGKAPVAQSVTELIEPGILANGLELVDVEFKKEGQNWVLRIYIDSEGGITLAECQKVSRLAGDLIEIEEVIEPVYTLEVSSPGLNRVLKKEKDFLKYSGKKIYVQCHAPMDGRKKFTGILTGFIDQSIHLELDGQRYTIPLSLVAKANLVIEI